MRQLHATPTLWRKNVCSADKLSSYKNKACNIYFSAKITKKICQ